jgi:hypothetical protein
MCPATLATRVDARHLEREAVVEDDPRLGARRQLHLVSSRELRTRLRLAARDRVLKAHRLPADLDRASRPRQQDDAHRALSGEDDGRAGGAELLSRNEVVAADVSTRLLTHVEVSRRGEVRDVQDRLIPQDHDLDGLSRGLDLFGRHRGPTLDHLIRVRPLGRVVRNLVHGSGGEPALLSEGVTEGAGRGERARRRRRERVRVSEGAGTTTKRAGRAPERTGRAGDHSRDSGHGRLRRRGGRGRGRGGDCHRLRSLEDDLRAADLDLIADADLALVDARAVHQRARLVAEIDQGDVVGPCPDLDDGVHARCKLVLHAQMALRVFADLDDVLRHRLTAHERLVLVQPKREGDLLLPFHDLAFPTWSLRPTLLRGRSEPPTGDRAPSRLN